MEVKRNGALELTTRVWTPRHGGMTTRDVLRWVDVRYGNIKRWSHAVGVTIWKHRGLQARCQCNEVEVQSFGRSAVGVAMLR